MKELFLGDSVTLYGGDSRTVLLEIPDNSIDSVVTDPPYALVSIVKRFGKTDQSDDTQTSDRSRKGSDGYARLAKGFMGKEWDNGETAFASTFWAEIFRVLKPGGHVAAFSGTRTYHRLAVAIEDSGFEIRDMIAWTYGTGFPKSHNVSKAIDRHNGDKREQIKLTSVRNQKAAGGGRDGAVGATRPFIEKALAQGFHMTDGPSAASAASAASAEWDGYGTALKPALEPICLARKPLIGTVAENVLEHRTGALNIDGCRVEVEGEKGRWPANVIHDGSDEVLAGFPHTASGKPGVMRKGVNDGAAYGKESRAPGTQMTGFGDEGNAARFFYSVKADSEDRFGSKHPTVKPVDLMQWLVRLITPKGGVTLDPFAGTGTTGEAAWREGVRAILIEREQEYLKDIRVRLTHADSGPMTRQHARTKNSSPKEEEIGGLFGNQTEKFGSKE